VRRVGGEEVDGVYPLCFAISSEEFFVEVDIFFGVDACGKSVGWPFNGAVDAFIIETFIDEAAIAGDPSFGGPAVNVALALVCWVGEEVHGGLGDAFLEGAHEAVVGAYEVAFPDKEVAEVGAFGIVGALGADSKEAHANVGVICGKGGWGYGNAFGFPKWVCEGSRDGERLWFIRVNVGHRWGSVRSGVVW
jgi:hypothetical protein